MTSNLPRTYGVWADMKKRCNNPKCKDYPRYGGRGIKVCERWNGRRSFSNFVADMGEQPQGMVLDRINNDGNYEPGNCKWSSTIESARNTSRNRFLEFNGLRLTVMEWRIKLRHRSNAIDQRLKMGWSVDRTLGTPVRPLRRKNVS